MTDVPAAGERGTVNLAQVANYRLDFAGLYCRDETDWDRGSGSDEPYVIVTATDGFKTWSRSSSIYGGVDRGHTRQPDPALLSFFGEHGPEAAKELALVVTVMEHDDGNADAHKDKIRIIVEAARVVATASGVPIPSWVGAVTVEVVNKLLGSGDDEIRTHSRVLPASHIRWYGDRAPLTFRDLTYNFWTRHQGDGADYYVMFRVRRM
jgi:hypothetical protein